MAERQKTSVFGWGGGGRGIEGEWGGKEVGKGGRKGRSEVEEGRVLDTHNNYYEAM